MKASSDSHPLTSTSGAPRKAVLGVVLVIALGAVAIGAAVTQSFSRDTALERQNYLRQVALAGVLYADDTRAYPYVEGDWDKTIDLLYDKGYLTVLAPEGATFEGFKAPYGRRLRGTVLLAWGEVETDREGNEVRTIVGTDLMVVTLPEDEFQKIKTQHDRYAARVLAARPRSSQR